MKQLRRSSLLVLVAAYLLAGCTVPNRREGEPSAHTIVPADSVTIYRTPVQVSEHYQEIAVLLPGRDYPQGDYESMRQRAAALGANAIILDAPEALAVSVKPASKEYVLATGPEHVERVIAVIVGDTTLNTASNQ